jgi:hypothetical protein
MVITIQRFWSCLDLVTVCVITYRFEGTQINLQAGVEMKICLCVNNYSTFDVDPTGSD